MTTWNSFVGCSAQVVHEQRWKLNTPPPFHQPFWPTLYIPLRKPSWRVRYRCVNVVLRVLMCAYVLPYLLLHPLKRNPPWRVCYLGWCFSVVLQFGHARMCLCVCGWGALTDTLPPCLPLPLPPSLPPALARAHTHTLGALKCFIANRGRVQ